MFFRKKSDASKVPAIRVPKKVSRSPSLPKKSSGDVGLPPKPSRPGISSLAVVGDDSQQMAAHSTEDLDSVCRFFSTKYSKMQFI